MDSTVLNSCRVGQFHLGTSRRMHAVTHCIRPTLGNAWHSRAVDTANELYCRRARVGAPLARDEKLTERCVALSVKIDGATSAAVHHFDCL